jgi:outer membrane protein assembly factor BamB
MQGDWQPVRVRDGAATELVTPWQHRWLLFISADDGHLLRRSDLTYIQRRIPVADGAEIDLDGDGVAELLFQCQAPNDRSFFVQAVSGRTGEVLWRSNFLIPQTQVPDFSYSVSQDLDGDGRPEVLCVYRSSLPDHTYTLAVLSGSDGRLRWKQPLIERVSPQDFNLATRLVPGIGDLDGDGVKDVVAWALSPDHKHEIRAFSGVDGHLLWSHALDSAQEEGLRRASWGVPLGLVVSVGDLDGNGRPVVIVQRPDKDQGQKESCEVLVLEGRDGRTRWSQRVPAKPSADIADPIPLLLSDAGGSRIAVVTVDPASNDRAQIVMLDHTGNQCGRAPVAITRDSSNNYVSTWNASVRMLSQNRLLLIGSGKLRLLHGGIENTRWTWSIPGDVGAMVDIIPPSQGKAETVVVQAGSHVYGVDAGTGKTIWTCMGPGRCTHALPAASDLPRLLFEVIDPKNEVNVNTVCRRAIGN